MLTSYDAMRIDVIQRAVEMRDAFILIAELSGAIAALAIVHLHLRSDMGWEPGGDTEAFMSNENAYLENLEVRDGLRSQGIGRSLLHAVEHMTGQLGKTTLWLHTGEWNVRAHQFYAREGWQFVTTVYPAWRSGKPTRIYRKTLLY